MLLQKEISERGLGSEGVKWGDLRWLLGAPWWGMLQLAWRVGPGEKWVFTVGGCSLRSDPHQ